MSTLLVTLALAVPHPLSPTGAHSVPMAWTAPSVAVARAVARTEAPGAAGAAAPEPRAARGQDLDPEVAPVPRLRFAMSLSQLGWEGGAPDLERRLTDRNLIAWPQPRVVLEGEGRAYLGLPWLERFSSETVALGDLRVGLSVPADARVVRGRLEWPGEGATAGGAVHTFALRLDGLSLDDPSADLDFRAARYLHAAWRHGRGVPGAAWWRHRMREDGEVLDAAERRPAFDPGGQLVPARGARPELDDAYDLLTGGRALSENLALDRVLEPGEGEPRWVDVATLEGITTPAFDWEPLVRDLTVEPLPLAHGVPADQHALFFPDLRAALRVLEEVERGGTPVLELFEARSEDLDLRARYERQLALELDPRLLEVAGRFLGRVAVTGSDPYLRTGTDVAVLFEAPRGAAAFEAWMRARQAQVAAEEGVELEQLALATGIASVLRTRDRSRSSYLLRVGDVVVVCNSPALLERLDRTFTGELPSLAGLDEYRFFQDRYLGGEGPEPDAFLVLSDDAIRRWCGPEWRIGAARRTRAGALLAEGEAALLADRAARARPVVDDVRLPGGDRLRREVFQDGRLGVRSETYGTTRYQTPIRELDLARVTEAEAAAYRTWRAAYARRWTRFFDPIAAALTVRPEGLDLDVSVLPLSAQSDYSTWVELTEGGRLAPDSGDPREDVVLSFALAVDPERSGPMTFASLAAMVAPSLARPLAWMDGSVVLTLERSPFWAEALASGDLEGFVGDHLSELPVTLRLDSHDPLRLTAFIAGLRAWLEQSAPDLLTWEPVRTEHGSYVRLAQRDGVRMLSGDPVLAYAALPEAWVIGFSEGVIVDLLERRAEAAPSEADPDAEPAARGPEWLGDSLGLYLGPALRELLAGWWRSEHAEELQALAWDTLDILDELRAAGHEDPGAVLLERFGVRPACPGGGAWVWDAERRAHRSSVFGSPMEPAMDLELPPGLAELRSGRLGVTFEHGGLRARVRLDRTPR